MFEPQGPLPPEVYWRRRVAAVGAAVVVVAVVVGLIFWAASGSGSKPKQASDSQLTTPTTTLPSAAPSSDASTSGVSGGGTGPADSSADPSGSAAPSGPATPAAVPATGLCPDQNISVVLYSDKPDYVVGDKATFTMVVTNAGATACTRDVGQSMQNVTVRTLDGTKYIWSAGDCAPIAQVNNQLLQPGQQFKSNIAWSGTTSAPGCQGDRTQIGPGSYQAVAKLGEKLSAPITFNVAAAPIPPGA